MIQVTISDADMKNHTVTEALSALIAAMGPRRPGRPRGSVNKSAPATAATAKTPGRRGRKPKAAKAEPKPRGRKPSPELWASFVDGLNEKQRSFLSILEKKKVLSTPDATKELGLSSPKALGGLVGALNRWAPARGIRLPFSLGKDESGAKAWVWRE